MTSSIVRTSIAELQPTPGALLFAQEELSGEPEAPSENIRECFPEIIGTSRAMQQVLLTVRKIARSSLAVMIGGESGTGKELIAAALHRLSPRSAKRFVAINCSAIPDSLLESELFGHEKGAFTGAVTRRPGFFELAHGGSIFLDEIGDMPLSLQAKLLRVLQEKQFTPVGSRETMTSDVRIIAATNLNLKEAVSRNLFRQDLYYRLNVLPITLPPLRAREQDISLLVEHFALLASRRSPQGRSLYFHPEALEILAKYPWPGNVRELQSLIERLAVMHESGAITPQHLPAEMLQGLDAHYQAAPPYAVAVPPPQSAPSAAPLQSLAQLPSEGIDLLAYIENLENSFILQALAVTGNNKNKAAQLLGLNRTTLVERIKKRRLAPLNDPPKEL